MRARKCLFCGGMVSPMTGDEAGDMRAHFLSTPHRNAMQPRPTVKRVIPSPYVEADPYEPSTASTGPMHTLLSGAKCQGCGETVDVVRYTGRILSVHPTGSLACRDTMRQSIGVT